MKLERISFGPRARVRFTDAEIKILVLLSSHHYDSLCRQARLEGGFLFGIAAAQRNKFREHTLSWEKVDILAKITELSPHLAGTQRTTALRLHGNLVAILAEFNVVTPEPIPYPTEQRDPLKYRKP